MAEKQKTKQYRSLLHETKHVLGYRGKYTPSIIGKMAISSAILVRHLPDVIFAGYYLINGNRLEIGPYQGKIIACTPIPIGKGICGSCAQSGKVIIADDVSKIENYIACDDETISEIVIPVFDDTKIFAVLDIDGRNRCQFDQIDAQFLQEFLNLIFH